MALLDEQAYIGYPQMGRRRAMPNRDVEMNQGLLRGASYYPYDLLGSPIDLINMGLKPLGMGSQKPVMGSDYLQSLAQQYGLSQQPTGSNAENVARLAMSAMNPATGVRAVGRAIEPTMQALAPKAGQMAEDYLRSIGGIADITPQGKKSVQNVYEGAMPQYTQQENLANVFENAGLKVKESGSSRSNSKYVEIVDPVSGEVITARFANHPQSGQAMTLHGPADIEIGDIFKYKSWNEAVDPILERINKSRKEYGDELLTIKQVEGLLD